MYRKFQREIIEKLTFYIGFHLKSSPVYHVVEATFKTYAKRFGKCLLQSEVRRFYA